eukprot:7379717-Prymnesium_polylepis.1
MLSFGSRGQRRESGYDMAKRSEEIHAAVIIQRRVLWKQQGIGHLDLGARPGMGCVRRAVGSEG